KVAEAVNRRTGRHDQRQVAEVVAVGESDCATACFGGDDRRRTDVEAPPGDLRQQCGELGAREFDAQAQLGGDRPQQLAVVAGEAAAVEATARRTARL